MPEIDNELVAQYMGHNKNSDGIYSIPEHGHPVKIGDTLHWVQEFRPNQLKYNSSFEWLMPVLDRIKETAPAFCNAAILYNGISSGCCITIFTIDEETLFHTYPKVNTEGKTILSTIFAAIIAYINWYNNYMKRDDGQ